MSGRGWLVAFSEIEGLRWVIKHRRMAFSPGLNQRAAQIRPGDTLVLYVTRGAFHNPTRDESQVAGTAAITTEVKHLRKPIVIAGREFTAACELELLVVLPAREGLPIKPLVPRLRFVKKKDVWGGYVRSGLVALPDSDVRILSSELGKAKSYRSAGAPPPQ